MAKWSSWDLHDRCGLKFCLEINSKCSNIGWRWCPLIYYFLLVLLSDAGADVGTIPVPQDVKENVQLS